MSFESPLFVTTPLLPDLEKLDPYLKQIWKNKWLTNHGEFHNRFEKRLTTTLDIPNVSVFNNGTTSLLIALKALDLPQGSEVITTPFTFPATPHSIMWNHLIPVFCDVEPDTMTIDPEKIEALITSNTSAIMGVHVYGFPCKVDAIDKLAKRHNLKVIYDASHAFGLEINGHAISNYGDLSSFSFHATKLFNTIEGGALAYTDDTLKEKIYHLRNFGIKNEEEVIGVGINGKLNEIQSAIGLLNLDIYEEERAKRQTIRAAYNTALDGIAGLEVLKIPDTLNHSQQYFVVRVKAAKRNLLYEGLKKENVLSRKYFYPLCSNYDIYANFPSAKKAHLPVSNRVSDEVLCLPFYGDLGEDTVAQIGVIIRKIMETI